VGNFIFILIILFSLVLSKVADKRNNKFILLLLILILTLTSGLRGINVGIDTSLYNYAFIHNFPYSWQFEEIGFRYISNLIITILGDPKFVFIFYSLIINLLIVLRLWDFRKKCSFAFMLFIYLLTFYLDSMNIMRQLVAVAVIFYSTKLLEKKHYFLFFSVVLFMTLIHKTALFGLALIVIYLWNSLSLSKKILMSIPLVIISGIVILYTISFEAAHISNYLSSENAITNINITFMYRLLCFIFSWLLYKSNKKIVYSSINIPNTRLEIDLNFQKKFNIISTIYFLGLAISSIGMFYVVMSRLGYYYIIFELLYWGYLVKNSKNKMLNLSLISIYVIYIFVFEICTGGNGVFPFSFRF